MLKNSVGGAGRADLAQWETYHRVVVTNAWKRMTTEQYMNAVWQLINMETVTTCW